MVFKLDYSVEMIIALVLSCIVWNMA